MRLNNKIREEYFGLLYRIGAIGFLFNKKGSIITIKYIPIKNMIILKSLFLNMSLKSFAINAIKSQK